MSSRALATAFLGLAAHVLLAPTTTANFINHPEDGVDRYITRPDIVSPRWDITFHGDKSKIAPGYWFVAPYEKIGERRPGGAWIGPHIYDGEGALIWSGSYLYDDRNIMDFKLSNVRGEERLTMMLPPDEDGLILDNHYQILEKVDVGVKGKTLNMHEFSFADRGDTLLLMKRNVTHATREQSKEVGFDGECSVMFAGFDEVDTTTWENTFTWTSSGVIPLSESTYGNTPEGRCAGGAWDYLHSNALDKFDDGHFLLSARHSDTIYKISRDDGSILWRLGGKSNDFTMLHNLNFSRQHHARFREQNATHTIISLFDNSKGEDRQAPTSAWSRALILALRTDTIPMTAELVQAYDHPHHEYAWRRGNFQILPKTNNAFICWSEHSLQSEHTPDGTLLWEARMQPSWIGTYRAFKHEFVGLPLEDPDIHSQAFYHPANPASNATTTLVHASWNGATEVRQWNLYKTSEDTRTRVLLSSYPRTGFETPMQYDGYATYVQVEALSATGSLLGTSKVLKTIPAIEMNTLPVQEEQAWLDSTATTASMIAHEAKHALSNPIATFFGGVIAMGVVVFVIFRFRRRRSGEMSWLRGVGGAAGGNGRYARVDGGEAEADWDETKLDELDVSSSSSNGRGGKGGMRRGDSDEHAFALTDEEDEAPEPGRGAVSGRTPYRRDVTPQPGWQETFPATARS